MIRGLILGLAILCGCAALFAQSALQPIRLEPAALAVSGTYTGADQTNASWRGGSVVVNVSALSGGSWTPSIQGKDPVSGSYYTILTGSSISGTGTSVLSVYPSITVTTNTASAILPYTWRLSLTASSSPVGTLTVGGFLAP